mgnify:CR=1 FL=1
MDQTLKERLDKQSITFEFTYTDADAAMSDWAIFTKARDFNIDDLTIDATDPKYFEPLELCKILQSEKESPYLQNRNDEAHIFFNRITILCDEAFCLDFLEFSRGWGAWADPGNLRLEARILKWTFL